MPSQVIVYLGIGKLLIYTIQKAPYFRWARNRWGFVEELLGCSYCVGFWVYMGVSLVSGHNWFTEVIPYIPLVSNVITGMCASFVMYVLSSGWDSLFREVRIE